MYMWVTSLVPHESQQETAQLPYSCFTILGHIFSIYKIFCFVSDNVAF